MALLLYVLSYLGVHVLVHRSMSWSVVAAAVVSGIVFVALGALSNRRRARRGVRT